MSNLKIQSVVTPVEHLQFEDWFRELNVSSQWKANSIAKRIVMDEAIQLKNDYIKTFGDLTPQKESFLRRAYHKTIEFIKLIDIP